jgi:hypothetical protein
MNGNGGLAPLLRFNGHLNAKLKLMFLNYETEVGRAATRTWKGRQNKQTCHLEQQKIKLLQVSNLKKKTICRTTELQKKKMLL